MNLRKRKLELETAMERVAKAEEAGEVFVAPEPPKPKKKSKRFDLKVWWKENVMSE